MVGVRIEVLDLNAALEVIQQLSFPCNYSSVDEIIV